MSERSLLVAFMSLQDMDDAAGALRKAARVLAPGAHVVAIERDGLSFSFHQMHRSRRIDAREGPRAARLPAPPRSLPLSASACRARAR